MGVKEINKTSDSTPTTPVTTNETPVMVVTTSPSPMPITPGLSTKHKAPAMLDESNTPASFLSIEIEEEYARWNTDRDIVLAHIVGSEKRLSFIKAWEDNEKTKVVTKAEKRLGALDTWEKSQKYAAFSKLKGIEKAEAAEKMKNKAAQIHKEAEENRATVKAKREESILTIEKKPAKYRAMGYAPKKFCGCMSF